MADGHHRFDRRRRLRGRPGVTIGWTVNEHVDNLRTLRDFLVEDRRNLVKTLAADPHVAGEGAADLMNLQQFIDVIERAIGHEQSLDRPQGTWPPKPFLGKGGQPGRG
jgi:hypothetical protein